jgi:UDP-N-acetylmuramoylalanine--D-glutamate ligase
LKISVKILQTLEQVIGQIFDEIKNQHKQIIILFAPACTSYDQYKNFEERGMHFIKLIKKYSKNI